MELNLLKLDLQFFAEIDFDNIAANFDENYQEEIPATVEGEPGNENDDLENEDLETEEIEDEGLDADEDIQDEDLDDIEDDEENPNPNDADEHRRNQAFQQLRQQAEENKRYADLVQSIADASGTTVDAVIERFETMQLQSQADAQGVPLEVMKRLNAIEAENTQVKQQAAEEKFNASVKNVIEKYEATDEELKAAYEYAAENGLDLVNNTKLNFESIYRLAHEDKIVAKQVEKSRQKALADKKKRQKETPVPNGTSTSQLDNSAEEQAMRDAKEIVANW